MAVPNYQAFMRPLLSLAADGAEHSIGKLLGRLADELQLTEPDRSELLSKLHELGKLA
jgi:restriction system protein